MHPRWTTSGLCVIFSWLLPVVALCQSAVLSTADSAYALLIREEWERHPLMELDDLYKFVHQSAMGPGHAVHDTAEARSWMDREISGLSTPPDLHEPTVMSLRPDSELVRVNLRPYLEAGGDPETLLRAFIRSANEYEPSPERLRRYWSVVVQLARSGQIPVDADRAQALIGKMEASGFPPLHHSRSYLEAYRPAYRVVDCSLFIVHCSVLFEDREQRTEITDQ